MHKGRCIPNLGRYLVIEKKALHVFMGDEPLTEGIKGYLMRVKGMAEMT